MVLFFSVKKIVLFFCNFYNKRIGKENNLMEKLHYYFISIFNYMLDYGFFFILYKILLKIICFGFILKVEFGN